MSPPSLTRLYLLRAAYLLLVVGLGIQMWPRLFGAMPDAPGAAATVIAMLSALALVCILGLAAPLRMLPVLLWEIVWKVMWLLAVALPAWREGRLADIQEDLFAVGFVLPYILVFPWRRFAGQIAASLDRWR